MSDRSPAPLATFRTLFREFFAQFFASETVTSEVRLRQTMIMALAFLITPGVILQILLTPASMQAAAAGPAVVEALGRLIATVFLTFSTASVGLIAVLLWDRLSFDRRDAMVLGPLPISRTTIVAAKLAALGTFLVGVSVTTNVFTALLFAGKRGPAEFVAFLAATTCAAVFVFSAIVTIRAMVGLLPGNHAAAVLGSLLKCAFAAGVFCLVVFVPTTVQMTPHRIAAHRVTWTVQVATVPDWVPTNWFLALYLQLRSSSDAEVARAALRAVVTTAGALMAGAVMTVANYRRQLELALSPASFVGAAGRARISRVIASAMLASDRYARAISDFILLTIARNPAQQVPLGMNVALGIALAVLGLSAGRGGATASSSGLLAIPLTVAFWGGVGLRASFFVPSELHAAWMLRIGMRPGTATYALATRAAIVGFLLPGSVLIAVVVGALEGGWADGLRHAVIVGLSIVILADAIVLTVRHVPYIRPYVPGHAKLRSTWPLYLLGGFVFGRGLAAWEVAVWHDSRAYLLLLALIALIVTVEVLVRRVGRRWDIEDDISDDPDSVTTLNLQFDPLRA